jgi:glycerate 2-kinase
MNTVRQHISDLKGGGLAKTFYPAQIVSLIFSDVPGDDCSVVASGPTYKDETTIADAQALIDKYDLGDFELTETPKDDKYFEKVSNYLLVSNTVALDAMVEKASELGYTGVHAGCDLYHFPDDISGMFKNLSDTDTIVVAGGETRLIIPNDCTGKGGRNDFLSLHMAEHIDANQIFVSFASDGHDNTDAAGGIVDGDTHTRITELGGDYEKHKVCLDSYPLMDSAQALIKTGYIESNVSDLMFLLTWGNTNNE